MPPAHPYLLFAAVMTPISAFLIAIFVVFLRARRATCTWPPQWRRIAQIPGWFLVAWGAVSIVGLAVIEIREKRGGLGTGTLIAVISAGLRALVGPAKDRTP